MPRASNAAAPRFRATRPGSRSRASRPRERWTRSAQAYLLAPDSLLLAGGTDVGLWTTKQLRDLPPMLYVGDVEGLDRIEERAGALEIGAAASLTDAYAAIVARYPMLSEIAVRFGSPPVRKSGTLCGNLANGSPIGDSMPALIALGSQVVLRRGSASARFPSKRSTALPQDRLASGEFCARCACRCPRTARRDYKSRSASTGHLGGLRRLRVTLLDGACRGAHRLRRHGAIRTRRAARRPAGKPGGRERSRRVAALARFPPHRRHARERRLPLRVPAPCGALLRRAPAAGRRVESDGAAHERRRAVTHESAHLHVSGEARYADDIALPPNTLHAPSASHVAHGRIARMDSARSPLARRARGLHRRRHPGREQLRAGDPGRSRSSPTAGAVRGPDDLRRRRRLPRRRRAAPRARRRSRTKRCPRSSDPRGDRRGELHLAHADDRRGEPLERLAAPRRLQGTIEMGGQDHFYLEGQVAFALPQENGGHGRGELDAASDRGAAPGGRALGRRATT
jgi:hypothetical protein